MKPTRLPACAGVLICLLSSAPVAHADGHGLSVRRAALSPATETASTPLTAETLTAMSELKWDELDNHLPKLGSRVSQALEIARSFGEFVEEWQALSQADREIDLDPRSLPQLPSSCVGKPSSECECFDRAYRDLQDLQGVFERLRLLGLATKRMVDSAVALGDSVASIGLGAGLGWIAPRMDIQQSMDDFEQIYAAKHAELVDDLYGTLQEIAACEAKLGDRDWYSRAGFIYYELMKERYRRVD